MPIHLGKTQSKEGWVGFETDERLTRTKERLRTRCLPCMTGLYDALREGVDPIPVPFASECWKVTVVVDSPDACVAILEAFQERFPDEYVYGKFGGGVGRPTSAVIFTAESVERRDRIAGMLSDVLSGSFPGLECFVSRGCANPFERLFGPWRGWKGKMSPVSPERAEEVRKTLHASLYRRWENCPPGEGG